MTGASALVAGRMFSMSAASLGDVPAHVFSALEYEALVWQALATHIVNCARTVEIVLRRELLHDAQRRDHGLTRALVVGACSDQCLARGLRRGPVEVGAHVFTVVSYTHLTLPTSD